MKFNISFKTPDAVEHAINEEMDEWANNEREKDMNEEEVIQDMIDDKIEEFTKFMDQWIQYGENITIEFDTEANTATVRKLNPKD